MRHLWCYLNLFPIICLILKKIKIFFNIIAKKKFELIYKDWSKLFVRYTPLRNPQVGLHDVYNLIEVISSWTEQKLRSILKCKISQQEHHISIAQMSCDLHVVIMWLSHKLHTKLLLKCIKVINTFEWYVFLS